MQDFEKLGVFYLGREYSLEQQRYRDDLVLYDAKDLTTHAVCVGMTGSGKTGLCLSLLEEAAIDGIPAICIDPKGDLGNLLLTFPELRPADFQPWLDPQEATRQGLSVSELATKTAKTWKEGLATWGQDGARIQRYREAVDIAIYTPGSTAGLPLTVLKSFNAPPESTRANNEALRERVSASVSGLLALMGIDADPLRSREFILLATLLDRAWREGRDVDLGNLIRDIQQPPFQKVGFMDVDSFFPAKDRFEFSMALNNLLASPGFQAWLQGEPLDVQRLFYTPEGKPRLVVVSIAHLNDAERMFFVTILLNEVLGWMRAQSGTSSLRAILYMDEIFGYFPPTANPPSKTPLLTLMKQARAFGLGVVLATQNPVDIDYKGLSNAGTWFLGRLQTERDKLRVLDGLEGASTAAGKRFDRARMEQTLSALTNRVFLMNNVHEEAPIVFQTRWALSFLRGPLTRDQIDGLMKARKSEVSATSTTGPALSFHGGASTSARPMLPPDVSETFLPLRGEVARGAKLVYRPSLLGTARVHYAQATNKVDHWGEFTFVLPIDDETTSDWIHAERLEEWHDETESSAHEPADFANLPSAFLKAKHHATCATSLKDYLYRTARLTLWKAPTLKEVSSPEESEGDFRTRISTRHREKRDLHVEKLRAKYAPKFAALQEQIRKSEQRVEKEKEQAQGALLSTALNVGSSILGAMLGRKMVTATNIGKAVTSARSAGKAMSERADIGRAEETVEALTEKLQTLNAEFDAEVQKLMDTGDESIELEELTLTPKKTDIAITRLTLLWLPYSVGTVGEEERLFHW